MASPNSTNWDLQSDEIASIDSEDLHTNRPNRWTGSRSTWRHLTQDERHAWRSIKQVQNGDLSCHLYNAFALTRQSKDQTASQDLTVILDNGRNKTWAPPRDWTAWPLEEKSLPELRNFKTTPHEADEITYRKMEPKMPSTDLGEEIGATMLRIAKERFQRRQQKRDEIEELEVTRDTSIIDPAFRSGSPRSQVPRSEASNDEAMADDDEVVTISTPDSPTASSSPLSLDSKATYPEAVISTDDDFSYELLRPSINHILSLLDKTLAALHNNRIASLGYLYNSSASGEDSDVAPPRGKAERGQSRRLNRRRESSHGESVRTSKRGRPRKIHIRLGGETDEQMQMRVARQSHRMLPESAFEAWVREGNERWAGRTSASAPSGESTLGSGDEGRQAARPHPDQFRSRARLGLRDWRDVLGAASLAGFSEDVISRTTKRCADLFRENASIRFLDEVPASLGAGTRHVVYKPEAIGLDPGSDSGADASTKRNRYKHHGSPSQRSRSASYRLPAFHPNSMQTSVSEHPHSSSNPTPRRQPGTPRSSQSTPQPRSRSRTSQSSSGNYYCPVITCERASDGFTRKLNMTRHVQLVHPGHTSDVDSEDELVGAVHTDGFLKYVTARKQGWSEPTKARSGTPRGRRRKRRNSDTGDLGSEAGGDEQDS